MTSILSAAQVLFLIGATLGAIVLGAPWYLTAVIVGITLALVWQLVSAYVESIGGEIGSGRPLRATSDGPAATSGSFWDRSDSDDGDIGGASDGASDGGGGDGGGGDGGGGD